MIKKVLFFSFLLLILMMNIASWSKLIEFQVLNSQKEQYSFTEVCDWAGQKEKLLIESFDANTVDCMGKIVEAKDFCLHKIPQKKGLIRAYADDKKKQVVCQKGDQVLLQYSCQNELQYCKDAKKGCLLLKEKLVQGPDLIHSSLTTNNQLNCYFAIDDSKMILQ